MRGEKEAVQREESQSKAGGPIHTYTTSSFRNASMRRPRSADTCESGLTSGEAGRDPCAVARRTGAAYLLQQSQLPGLASQSRRASLGDFLARPH